MDIQKRLIDRIVFYIVVMWTFLLVLVAGFLVKSEYDYAYQLAKNEAKTSVKKDLAYREWVASHGGVYVPITDKTQPNPYLSHVKNRDVNTSANQKLTLMNPAYTLSQMMSQYSELYGRKAHITSKVLLNPKNAPDDWERAALDEIDRTKKPVLKISEIDGEKYMRYINPMVTQESCLKCHGFQGYKVGDIRGGVSVSVPMKQYLKEALSHSFVDIVAVFLIYSIGLVAIFYGRKFTIKEVAKKVKNYEQNIFSMVEMIEKRDSYTAGHTTRVAKYSALIAKEMGYSQEKEDELYRACMLHDIGKISTPDSILLKPGKLSDLEHEIIKEHVSTSYEILKKIDIYKDIAEIVKSHHERYDGTGYPEGLKADEIPQSTQIMTIADAFDAMTTNRIYKARKSVKQALKELEELSGTQFNPEIVKHAIIALSDVKVDIKISQRPKTKTEQQRFVYFYSDPITELYNKEYLSYVLAYNHTQEFNMLCLHSISLHKFSPYNKKYGWSKGDQIFKKITKVLNAIDEEHMVFRIFGDYFVILSQKHFALKSELSKIEKILEGTGISFSHKHFDVLKDEIRDISDLEKVI